MMYFKAKLMVVLPKKDTIKLVTRDPTPFTKSGVLKLGDVIDPAYLGVYFTE